jgi:hypothetical protein
VASSAGSPVRAEALKERPTQIDTPGIAVCPGKTGEVEKWKQIVKVNVGDGRTRSNGHKGDNAENHSPSDPALGRITELLT